MLDDDTIESIFRNKRSLLVQLIPSQTLVAQVEPPKKKVQAQEVSRMNRYNMFSLASKRTASSIARRHQKLQRTTDIAASSRSKISTAATSSTKKQQQPLVISRRAWLEFKESRGIQKKRPDPSKRHKSDDDKPWPRNIQIAGYVAGTLAVPYIILWTITSNPTLREWFGPVLPMDKLRPYFGKMEWDAQNYSEEMERAKSKEKNEGDDSDLLLYYQYPEEDPCDTRKQQELVEAFNESDIDVTLSLHSSASPSLPAEEIVTKTISAKTVATAQNLLGYFPSALNSKDGNATVAVDFLDRKGEDSDAESFTTTVNDSAGTVDGTLMTDAASMTNGFDSLDDLTSQSRQLTKDSNTSSKWTYVPQAAGEASTKKGSNTASSSQRISQMEIEMGRLKYEISELEKSLKDPMCTRSIDDITTELRQAKQDLSRLTWKRRLGLGR